MPQIQCSKWFDIEDELKYEVNFIMNEIKNRGIAMI